ncbi:MAG: phosphoribosyl-ATP diphosphatase [Rhodospirillales bacterium]|nr:MAG: phosphoribosyl-ATP diphosphatase [Rhodospirillales bacterium]
MSHSDATILDRLFAVIESRRTADPAASWTAQLLAGGPPAAARKLGEESVEAIIAALAEDREALAAESADLLYHLLVLWAATGVAPADVWRALEARQGTSGVAEKAAREK